jgi:hypothetical protein
VLEDGTIKYRRQLLTITNTQPEANSEPRSLMVRDSVTTPLMMNNKLTANAVHAINLNGKFQNMKMNRWCAGF